MSSGAAGVACAETARAVGNVDRPADEPDVREIELAGNQRLVVARHHASAMLQLTNARGVVTLSIEVTESGPVLRFEGASLVLQAAGALTIEAEQLRLQGRAGVVLATDGDLAIDAVGDLSSRARIQTIEATLGNVNIAANDDVRIDGERVMVNC